MSSWLNASSQTTQNLLRTKQCVLNLPSDDMGSCINAIARTTGMCEIPSGKEVLGYEYCKDKFERSGLSHQCSDLVRPPRIAECPVQMESVLMNTTELMQELPDIKDLVLALEVNVLRTHVRNDLRMTGHANRIDPDRWRPMIMSFQELYGLSPTKSTVSRLATIDEEKYRFLTGDQPGRDMDTV